MHVTPGMVRAAGVTDEQAFAFAKRFPFGTTLTYQTLVGTGWRVEWLAALIEWPRRIAVYQAIDATWARFDAATLIQRESWKASQKRFQALAPDEEDRMIAAKWGTYKALKNAAEQRYYDETEKAFEALHAEQAQVIAAALASSASQPRL